MKPRHLILTAIVSMAATAPLLAVPTEIARESFEGTPGSIGFSTSVPQFIELGQGNPQSDYFSIIPNNGTKVSGNRTIPGGDGANMFAAEDCDTLRTLPAVAGPQEVSLTTNAVNIAGKTNTQLRLLMAAPGRDNGPPLGVSLTEYENFANSPLFINKLKVEASIDGGAFQRVVQFSPSVVDLPTTLSYDADGNNLGGDANPIPTNPTTLDATLREGIYSIPTGGTVAIRLTFETDATGELICFDNIRIFGENSATAAPVLGGVTATALTFTEGGAATAIAPAITVTDTDSTNLASATVTISQNYVNGEDVLAATPSGAILAGDIVFAPATGRLTITRSATKANYETVLRSVTYRDTNISAPSTSVRRVTFSASDGTNLSNSPIRDINVVDAIVTQAIPFVESWETDGRGSRYAVEGGFSSPPDMFARFQPAGVTGIDGTFAWGVENVDNNSDFTELVTFNLNAAGLVNLTGELRVAAGGGAVYDGGVTPDFLRVEASADGGAFQNVLAFYSDAAAQGTMRQDTTPGDATNLGNGTALTAALQAFTFTLPTANTLTVRIRAFTNIAGENILFDRLAVNGQVPPIIVTSTNDSGPGSLRTAVATALAQAGASSITFDPAVFSSPSAVITLATEIVITDTSPVSIDASAFDAGVTVSGNNVCRLFRTAAGTNVTLQRLHLHSGKGLGGDTPANYGGAIRSRGALTLTECSLFNNTTGIAGGAIYNAFGTQTLTLNRCTLNNNAGTHGGAIQNEAVLIATNCTFSNNTATVEGGAISSPFGKPASLIHCTVANNQATGAGGGGGGIGTAFTLNNSIVAGNTPNNIAGTPVLVGTNLTAGDPRLAPLAANGGFTRTRHPLPGSPARDILATTSVTTDQRGVTRGQWGASDIGAVEAGIQADCAWEVRDVFTSPVTVLGNLANTDAMLANPAATQITGTTASINFSDLNGSPNNGFFPTGDSLFLCDNLTPQGLINQDDDSFATQARAFITITAAGDYTFGFSSDDGARLRLYSTNGSPNPVFTSSTQLTGGNPNNPAHNGNALTFNAPTGDSATLGVVNLTPGVYGVEFTMWEDFGGSSAEVIFATGAQTAFGAAFSLLGGNMLTRTPGASRPVNDDFAASLPLSGAVVHTSSCNAGATIEAGEPTSVPFSSGVRGKSVWWTWTAPATAGYQVDTAGSSFDTVLAVLTGSSMGGLAEVAINDDTATLTSQVTFGAVAGTVYRIQVSGYQGAEGNILLNIGPPANFAPGFTAGPNQSVFTNAGPQTVLGWATGISPGAPWETTQSVSFTVSTTNPGLFVGTPAVLSDGTLTYVPAPTNGGTATVTVQAVDNGTPPLTSAPQSFTITTSLSPTTGTTLTINAGGTGSGTATLAQNFNTLSAASAPWVDNSTVPGWYAQINDGATPSGTFQPSAGATALNGLINCGSAAAPADRSLGSKATSTGALANISYAIVLRNVGNLPVKLSRLRYAEELWRSGSIASPTQVEKVTTFYAISNEPLASIASGPTAATAAPGVGFTAMPAGANTQIGNAVINTALDGNLPANRSAVDFTPLPADAIPAILPGQYFTLKWTDPNESTGTDGHQAIDDVTLDFAEIPCALFAAVNNVVRRYDGGTGATDTVDVTLTVAGAGLGLSPSGWSITAPAGFVTTGSYGVPKTITGLPLSAFTPTPVLAIRDFADANCTTTATVPLPLTLGYNFLSATTTYIQAGGTSAVSPLFRQTGVNDLTFDPGSAALTTDSIALTPGAEKCLALQVDVIDTSTNSGLEAPDTIKVELLSATPAGTEIELMSDDFDLNRDGVISGGATPLADEFNLEQKANALSWTSTFLLVGTIPADATSFRVRISAVINGQAAQPYTEVYRFRFASLRPCLDGDADGVSDFWESTHGTNTASAPSHYRDNGVTSTTTDLTFSVITGNTVPRTYQLLSSFDLSTWTRDGLPVTGHTDATGTTPLLFTRPKAGARNFYRVLVQQPQAP